MKSVVCLHAGQQVVGTWLPVVVIQRYCAMSSVAIRPHRNKSRNPRQRQQQQQTRQNAHPEDDRRAEPSPLRPPAARRRHTPRSTKPCWTPAPTAKAAGKRGEIQVGFGSSPVRTGSCEIRLLKWGLPAVQIFGGISERSSED